MLFVSCRENLGEGGIWDLYVHFGWLSFVTLCPPVACQHFPDWKCRWTLYSFETFFSFKSRYLLSCRYPVFYIVDCRWMNEYEVSVECYWQVKPTCSEKNLPGAPFFPTANFTWACLESNPGHCGEKPALNRLTFFCSRGKQAILISRAGVLPFSARKAD